MARLENHPSADVRELTRKLRGAAVSQDRTQVFNEYREVASVVGNPVHGEAVFQKQCATCHQLSGGGQTIGPNLAAMANRGAESLLFNVLVPSAEVDPRYLEYVLITADGEVLSGLITGETSAAVTLRGADNKHTTVFRSDIEDLRNTGRSLMPEGFEKVIDKRAMADLLAYLSQAATAEEKSR
jgi:putative heme-binding domain-containing protein